MTHQNSGVLALDLPKVLEDLLQNYLPRIFQANMIKVQPIDELVEPQARLGHLCIDQLRSRPGEVISCLKKWLPTATLSSRKTRKNTKNLKGNAHLGLFLLGWSQDCFS